jgi:Zn-dependent peptidase ImmA (M78 family)/DNA-binding XRE family transcriptional regulator
MFEPSRLALARRRAGISIAQLAKELDISAQSIHNYEARRQTPSTITLGKLATFLGLPTSFFGLPPVELLNAEQVTFRARSKLTAGARDQGLSSAGIAVELRSYIEKAFRGLPDVDIPTPEGPLTPETAAEYVRARWGLDSRDPAPNMIHLLESKGVAVFSLPNADARLDAFAFWRNERPYILLSTTKTSERGRFDAAHELAHLVLHSDPVAGDGKDLEKEANSFASAFLMPSLGVRRRIRPSPTAEQILHEKQYWKVAAMALAYRLETLGMLSEWSYRNIIISLGRRGYRLGEPDGIDRENSLLFRKIFTGPRGVQSFKRASSELSLPSGMLGQLTFGTHPSIAPSAPNKMDLDSSTQVGEVPVEPFLRIVGG